MYSLSSYVSLGLFLCLCVQLFVISKTSCELQSCELCLVCPSWHFDFFPSKTRLEHLHPITCFKSPVCDDLDICTKYVVYVLFIQCPLTDVHLAHRDSTYVLLK